MKDQTYITVRTASPWDDRADSCRVCTLCGTHGNYL